MSLVRRPIALPLGLLVLATLVVFGSWGQGLRMARDRQESLQPRRIVARIAAGQSPAPVITSHQRGDLLLVELGPGWSGRAGLYQLLPERTLVRWIEAEALGDPDRPLLIPLAGLGPGHYAITHHGPEATATVRDMDRPAEELSIVVGFELQRP